jgi:hypothetical protein
MWLRLLFSLNFLFYLVKTDECGNIFSSSECDSLLKKGSCLNDPSTRENCKKTCALCFETQSERDKLNESKFYTLFV